MVDDRMKERFAELERLSKAAGLDPYDVHFFNVPTNVIYEVASYGLPTRYSHWSFGRVYQQQRTQGEMGMSKIYELVLNNDPSYAFLDKNNPDTINLLICAHVLAHSDFFKNNVMFRNAGETRMIQVAKRHAEVIDTYRKDYGDDEVDNWLDVALALERHIDVYKGLHREKYPARHIEYKERTPTEWEDIVDRVREPLVEKQMKGLYLPPRPERDILWFLSVYANLEPWQERIFDIVRRESYYFYPQYRTKIMNEGWASYWHAELMRQYAFGNENDYGIKGLVHPLTAEEHLDFAVAHEKVVQPGPKIPLKVEAKDRSGKIVKQWNPKITQNPRLFHIATRINPYYVGFRMFRDIKERWDEYYKVGYREDEWETKIPVTVDGDRKIREVMMEEDDVSFFRNYLTEELIEELHLFNYGNKPGFDDNYQVQEDTEQQEEMSEQVLANKTIVVNTKELKDILKSFATTHANYGVPEIVIRRVDESGLMRLEHIADDPINVDIKYACEVLKYIAKAWSRPVEMIRKDKDKTWIIRYDGMNVEIDHEGTDYPEVLEENASPSSW